MDYIESIIKQFNHTNIINIECTSQDSDTILNAIKNKPNIGLVTRRIDLYERLKVKEYLKLYAHIDGIKNYQDIIQLMDLENLVNLRCGKLTHSQKRRVDIARALIKKPEIIFIQEPLIDLDETSIDTLLHWVNTLDQQQIKLMTTSLSLKATLLLPGIPFTLIDGELKKIQGDDYLNMVQQEPLSFVKISAKLDDRIFLFDPNDISYAEAQNSKTVIYVRNNTFLCQLTLEELEAKLKRFGFYRCHRSYLVNMQKVEEVIKWTKNSYSLKLRQFEEQHVPLSKGRIEEMRALYHL